jgi:Ser/Thr protein kinase RdoA (MazF antagonist)
MPLEDLARKTLAHYGLGDFEALGPIYKPSDSIGVGMQTTKGRNRLWRYHGFMTPEVVELQHALIAHMGECGVPIKRLIAARDGRTWREIDGQLVAVFEWFTGSTPDLRNSADLILSADLHAAWAKAAARFDPDIADWRGVARRWRPRKGWAWVLPTEDLPRVPKVMTLFAAVRDVASPPEHHDRMLERVRDTEARLEEFFEAANALDLARLPRGMNHGVFMFGLADWNLGGTDVDDYLYEARIGDVGRMVYAIFDWAMSTEERLGRAGLFIERYREQVRLSEAEVRALCLYAWAQQLYYDVFHVALYLAELSGPDRGAHLLADRVTDYKRKRDTLKQELGQLDEVLRA